MANIYIDRSHKGQSFALKTINLAKKKFQYKRACRGQIKGQAKVEPMHKLQAKQVLPEGKTRARDTQANIK